jgi:hypothetical protein
MFSADDVIISGMEGAIFSAWQNLPVRQDVALAISLHPDGVVKPLSKINRRVYTAHGRLKSVLLSHYDAAHRIETSYYPNLYFDEVRDDEDVFRKILVGYHG